MTDEEFISVVQEAIKKLPKEFRDQMDNVAITVTDWPSEEDLGNEPNASSLSLFGLYHGVPRTDRTDFPALPDKITIYKEPILHAAADEEDAKKIITDTVLHEIGHHFGLSDAELERIQGH